MPKNIAPRRRALCCECGNLRTVSDNYWPAVDANRITELDDKDPSRHWRMTVTLKCSVCGSRTRHALLRDNDPPKARNFAERTDYGLESVHPFAQVSDESLLREARNRMARLIKTVMKTVPMGELSMAETYDVMSVFSRIRDNHLN